ncbi:MFS transporter [Microbacterium hominis]|uniref:MFS transporter n=1 Tax=Microbacterium hominis TaxID=162426 RepID=A0A0B4CN69_9MICO|nr:MFS transporter [Microbacterium hominis]KIC57937.1 MFS transporter [Microbacterium hominis]
MPGTHVPERAGAVLTALLMAAAVCNLTTGGASVALPDIAGTFDAPQTTLNLVALGTGLGLAMTVLYAGALGDRYGRVRLLCTGLIGLLIAGTAASLAPTIEFLMGARVLTGIAAGCAFPTTLALITALWAEGPARVRAIALWTATGAVATVAGSVISGALVVAFGWRIALLLPVPVAVVALLIAARSIPRGVAESDEPVDHLGGILSVVAVAALVLGLGVVFAPGETGAGVGLLVAAAVLIAAFTARQLRVAAPLYDLSIARRRLFWVPAVAGTLAFGALVGAMFVGQQYLQNILGYDALQAGIALIPAAIALLVCAPLAAMLVERGTRMAMIVGYVVLIAAFGTMLAWNETTPPVIVALAFALVGGGASFVMTAASRSLTSSTPVRRAGMASATSDLQTDLGGAVMQALLGAVLAGGFSHVFAGLIAASPEAASLSDDITRALQASYASAAHVAANNPAYAAQILEAARSSFVDGAWAAYLVGAVALVLGLIVVTVGLPGVAVEKELRGRYRDEDALTAP